ncbi:phosphoserine phosphatase SerB [Helicobacter sp.]|uniref:phosphoserine phosphatase SerB n=1 Tax=Helicobacter sp. TaxID=218 RepID=UPI0025BB13B3|nr:phosphoserine phosphatase SerB [Helicobacter sp.]MBR2494525.1 phosphoserine phosphatase SerB [Helicobacter sp.]
MIKLAVFDFDSTLMDGETIDFLAKEYGVWQQVSSITERAMSGELDFFESLNERVALLKGLPLEQAKRVCQNLPLMQGAEECIEELKNMGAKVVCFSGGFHLATRYFANKLGLHADFSNILHTNGGFLSGRVGGDMMFSNSKGDMLRRLQSLLNTTKQETIAIGNGANDCSMLECAGYAVAFCAKPILKQHANIIIDEKDLRKILPYIH